VRRAKISRPPSTRWSAASDGRQISSGGRRLDVRLRMLLDSASGRKDIGKIYVRGDSVVWCPSVR
jgi:hypothetical protein